MEVPTCQRKVTQAEIIAPTPATGGVITFPQTGHLVKKAL